MTSYYSQNNTQLTVIISIKTKNLLNGFQQISNMPNNTGLFAKWSETAYSESLKSAKRINDCSNAYILSHIQNV